MTSLKKTKTSLPAIIAVALIALSISGFSYAHWCETLYIDAEINSGSVCVECGLFPPTVNDPPGTNDTNWDLDWSHPPWDVGKDFGNMDAECVDTDLDGKKETLEVTLNNVYPWYYGHVDFWIHNCGTIPWAIENVTIAGEVITAPGEVYIDLTGEGLDDIYIYWGNSFGEQREPCEQLNLSFAIVVLQDAPQGAALSFTITVTVCADVPP